MWEVECPTYLCGTLDFPHNVSHKINFDYIMKEAILYKKLSNSPTGKTGNKVKCFVCNHHCVIDDKERGLCGVRENQKGKLYSLVYGKVIAEDIDPIEKKPFFHFLPGTKSLSIATIGCNFRCLYCQNADISQIGDETGTRNSILALGKEQSPKKIVEDALKNNCPSIAYTYTEPTIFIEYALDIMKLAHKKNIKNIWVSNGYMTKESLDLISPYLDAINIDLKGFSEKFYQEVCNAKLMPVLENLKRIKKKKIWLEVTTLLIPGRNDSLKELKGIAEFIKRELGKETPWHISRFFPSYKMMDLLPTKIEEIYNAVKIGKRAGLKYVYSGNIPGNRFENTYCPNCGEKMIERNSYSIKRFDNKGKCNKCGESLDLIF